jgi:hypothetical protein
MTIPGQIREKGEPILAHRELLIFCTHSPTLYRTTLKAKSPRRQVRRSGGGVHRSIGILGRRAPSQVGRRRRNPARTAAVP